MHIKNIHCIIEKLAETTKVELDKGIENVDTKEMGEVADIIKDLAEAEYYAKISKAMDEADAEESLDMYEKHGMKYYNNRRYENGRFAPKGRGQRYFMPEYDMDIDHMDYGMGGKMYYNGSSGQSGTNSNMAESPNRYYSDNRSMQDTRDSREGRSGMARRKYYDSKAMHIGNTAEDKQAKMRELEKYMSELSTDMTEMITDMSQEEKNLLKSKMQTLMTKI